MGMRRIEVDVVISFAFLVGHLAYAFFGIITGECWCYCWEVVCSRDVQQKYLGEKRFWFFGVTNLCNYRTVINLVWSMYVYMYYIYIYRIYPLYIN